MDLFPFHNYTVITFIVRVKLIAIDCTKDPVYRHGSCTNTALYVHVYAFSRRFYPKRLTYENITLQLTSKLTISYIEGKHKSGSVRGDKGDSAEIEWRHRGKYRKRKCSRGGREVQGKG